MKCPVDQTVVKTDIDDPPVPLAMPDGDGDGDPKGVSGDALHYHSVKKRIEDLALYLKPAATATGKGRHP